MDLFNFIKNNINILDVISEYTNLKKAGSLYWKAPCPFHHEKTPSFTVSPHKNIYYCFGCHATGDVIAFIENIEHINPLQAAQHLAQRYNLDIPKELLTNNTQLTQQKSHYHLCQYVATWLNQMLHKNSQALQYLTNRKLTISTIEHFTLGYFPSGTRAIQQLIGYIINHGFTSQDLLNAHIINQGKQGLYSPYENRIIFPIKDHIGQTCGFGGRIFLPDDNRPKYYNSSDSPFFKKGKLLFGLDTTKHEIHKQQTALVVEGYMDCIALWQLGYKNSVATLGTACSTEHLQLLTKHAQTIYLLYDADNAGKQAILRLASSCWNLDLDLRVITLPTNQDPASMLEQNLSIKPCIDQATDIFNFFLHNKATTFQSDSIKHKMATLHEILNIIFVLPDTLKQNILLMKAAESLQIPLEILKKEYTNKDAFSKKSNPEPLPETTVLTTDKLEKQIIGAIAYDPNVLTKDYETLLTVCLSEKPRTLVQKIIEHRSTHTCTHSLEEMVEPMEALQAQALMFSLQDGGITQTFHNLMQQFQKKHWKSLTAHIRMKIMQAQRVNDESEVQRLLSVFEQLKIELCKNGRL